MMTLKVEVNVFTDDLRVEFTRTHINHSAMHCPLDISTGADALKWSPVTVSGWRRPSRAPFIFAGDSIRGNDTINSLDIHISDNL